MVLVSPLVSPSLGSRPASGARPERAHCNGGCRIRRDRKSAFVKGPTVPAARVRHARQPSESTAPYLTKIRPRVKEKHNGRYDIKKRYTISGVGGQRLARRSKWEQGGRILGI